MDKLGLTPKFILPVVLVMLLVQIAGMLWLNRSTDSRLGEQEAATLERLQTAQSMAQQERMQALQARADLLGQFLSKAAVGAILFDDQDALLQQQQNATAEGIAYVQFLGAEGEKPLVAEAPAPDRDAAIEKRYPVISKDKTIAQVAVGISKAHLAEFERANAEEIESLGSAIKNKRAEVTGALTVTVLVVGLVTLLLVSAVMLWMFRRMILQPLNRGRSLMEELASGDGDLTTRLPVPNRDEISAMQAAINQFTDKLHGLVTDMVSTNESLHGAAAELTGLMQEGQSRIQHQQDETTQVATAINEMAATVHEVARNTASAAESAHQANQAAGNGLDTAEGAVAEIQRLVQRIESTAEVIDRLNEDAAQVGGVLQVIRDIAEQTNLLALNAAIEAARAGEQGRGFAVVADEVRTLAGRTQQSTEEIRSIIEKLQNGSVSAVEAMNSAQSTGQQGADKVQSVSQALSEISGLVQRIADMNTQIASATEEQSAVAEEINQNITRLNQLGQESAASASVSTDSSGKVAELADHLKQAAATFKV